MDSIVLIYFVFYFVLKCDPMGEIQRKEKWMETQKFCVDYKILTIFLEQHTLFHILVIDMFNMHDGQTLPLPSGLLKVFILQELTISVKPQ